MKKKSDIGRKQPSVWPWVGGAVVLGLLVWGVTVLLRPPPQPEAPAVATEAVDTLPPATIPAPPGDVLGDPGGTTSTDLAGLGEQELGQSIRARGRVVATGNDSFWLLAGSGVIRVKSAREVRRGDSLAVEGRLREADPEITRSIADAVISREPDSADWIILDSLMLVEGG